MMNKRLARRPVPPDTWFEEAVKELQRALPPFSGDTPADLISLSTSEQAIQAAIFLKTAKYVSSLHAAKILFSHRHFQELWALFRIVDECGEDVTFLALALHVNSSEAIVTDYLNWFWTEPTALSEQENGRHKIATIRRRKIQAFIARHSNAGQPDSRELGNAEYLHMITSGYVHGSAAHILDLHDPRSGLFEVTGSTNRKIEADCSSILEDQYFRGAQTIAMAASVFGLPELFSNTQMILEDIGKYYC